MSDRLSLSIVTVCYNAQKTVADALQSVAGQTFERIEHIVVDGASTDGTLKAVESASHPKLTVISEPDRGIYDAMNKGVALATGDVVAFLNADDAYAHSGVAARAVGILEETGLDAVFGDVSVFARDFSEKAYRRYRSDLFTPQRLALGIMPAHPAMFVRRALFDRFGPFATDYRIAADFEFVARVFGRGKSSYVHCPEIWVNMRAGGASTRDLKARLLINRETLRACRANGIRTNHAMLLGKYALKLRELL